MTMTDEARGLTTEQALSLWQSTMRFEGLGHRTIRERLQMCRAIEGDIGKPLILLERRDIIDYLGSDLAHMRWKPNTRRHYRSNLRGFFTWLQDEGFRLDNPTLRLPRIAVPERDPNPVPVDDIARMLATGAYRKTRVMIALHYYAGLRVHEIAKMHGRDVDWRNRILSVTGKGGSTRRIGIGAALWEVIQDMPRDAYWFPNLKPNRQFPVIGEGHIMSNSVSDVIRDAMVRSGVLGHKPHDLRASTATEQAKAGVNPTRTQRSLRHMSYATTERYTRVDIEGTREAFDAQPVVPFPQRSGRRRAA